MPLIESKSGCRVFTRLDFATRNFYWTLKTHLDPLGRISGDPEYLLSTLFPLERNLVRITNIVRWLDTLRHANIVRCYTDSKSQPIVEVPDAVQKKLRYNVTSKYESFDGGQIGFQLEQPPPKPDKPKPSKKNSAPAEEKRREEKKENNTHAPVRLHGIPSTVEEVIACGAALVPVVEEETCRDFWSHYEGQARTGPNGEIFWITSAETVITNWKVKLPSFRRQYDKKPNSPRGERKPESNQRTETIAGKKLL